MLLSACAPPLPVESGDRADSWEESGGREDTGDTGRVDTSADDTSRVDTAPGETGAADTADEDTADTPVCALTAPGEVDGATLGRLMALGFYEDFPHFDEIGADPGCPVLTMEGTTEVWTGGCSTEDGRVFSGSVRIPPGVRFEAFTVAWSGFVEEAADGTFRYAVDGTRTRYAVDEGFADDVALNLSIHGSDDPDVPDGERSVTGTVSYINAREYLDLAVSVAGEAWCLRSDRSWWDAATCGEHEGVSVIVGARVARYVEQGWPECDGCVCYAPEDGAAEAVCL
jgi:hypothetical protein